MTRMPKTVVQTMTGYRVTHTAAERRRREKMKELFEKLKVTLGLHAFSKVANRILLEQASEEIQRLTDQADKLTRQKNLLIRKQDSLFRKVSGLAENEDSLLMPKVVNVMSLPPEGNTHLNPVVNKNLYLFLDAYSPTSEPALQAISQETAEFQSENPPEATYSKKNESTGTAQGFHEGKDKFSQLRNVSSLKDPPELAGSQARAKQPLFLQVMETDSETERKLQKLASVVPEESARDAGDLMYMEEDHDTDETLTSIVNEIAFLNQHLNDSDTPKHPSSLNDGFCTGDVESCRESGAEGDPALPFGLLGSSFKDLCLSQENNSISITPLFLQLEDDSLIDGERKLRSPAFKVLKLMLGSEGKVQKPDISSIARGQSGENMLHPQAQTAKVSPHSQKMKTKLQASNSDITWRPMPKLAPFGLKGAQFPWDSRRPNTKARHVLAPVATTELKTTQPATSQGQGDTVMPVLVSAFGFKAK